MGLDNGLFVPDMVGTCQKQLDAHPASTLIDDREGGKRREVNGWDV